MNDLGQEIRAFYDAAGPPLDIEAIMAERAAAGPRNRLGFALAASATAAVVLVLLVAYVMGLSQADPVPIIDDPPTANPAPTPGPTGQDLVIDPEATQTANALIPLTGPPAPNPTVPPVAPPVVPTTGPTSPPVAQPAHPLNGRILLSSVFGSDSIAILDVNGADPRPTRLGVSGRNATWSPDGTRVAFVGEHDNGPANPHATGAPPGSLAAGEVGYFLVNPDGSGLVELATFSRHAEQGVGTPQPPPFFGVAKRDFPGGEVDWSPDSQRVVWAEPSHDCVPATFNDGCTSNPDAGIWIANRNGGGRQLLVAGHGLFPRWTADGAGVVFVTWGPPGVGGNNYQPESTVEYVNATGLGRRTLHSASGEALFGRLDVSSRGTVAFHGPELMVVELSGGSARRVGGSLDQGIGVENTPAPQWSPDGSRVAFGLNSIVNRDGSGLQQLSHVEHMTWTHEGLLLSCSGNEWLEARDLDANWSWLVPNPEPWCLSPDWLAG